MTGVNVSEHGPKCIFCGRSPTTIEHALPTWLTATLPGSGGFTNVLALPHSRRWRSPELDLKTRSVCARCNSGWMSMLETEVRPILSAMLRGLALPLGPASQRTLATWACKTAFVLDQLGHRDIPPAILQTLFAEGAPGIGWLVWLARYAGPISSVLQGSVLFDRNEPSHHLGWLGTLAVGTVVFQVLTPFSGEDFSPWGDADFPLFMIWPFTTVMEWPPSVSLTSLGLAKVARRTE